MEATYSFALLYIFGKDSEVANDNALRSDTKSGVGFCQHNRFPTSVRNTSHCYRASQ